MTCPPIDNKPGKHYRNGHVTFPLQASARCYHGCGDDITSLRSFRFGFDPVCLVACAAYGLNRWGMKSVFDDAFLHGTFNDLLLIPAALPWVLWVQSKWGWRPPDAYPTSGEIVGHLLVWSVIAEGVMPLLSPRFTADWLDAAAYAVGAGVAAGFWMIAKRRP